METNRNCLARRMFSVLIIDSNEAVRARLARRLRIVPSIKWVNDAESVSDARRIIGGSRPEVLLLDPGGWQSDWRAQLDALAAIRPEGSVIVLHVTRPHNGYVREARALGADIVVLKGLKTTELVDVLAREVGAASE
jgi:DNA-binding NarL/FixJ family response regulator